MLTTVTVLVLYILVNGIHQIQTHSTHEDRHHHYSFGQRINTNRPYPGEGFITTSRPIRSKPQYGPSPADDDYYFSISEGDPVSTFQFADNPDSLDYLGSQGSRVSDSSDRVGQEVVALGLNGTEELAERSTEPNDGKTDIVIINPNSNPVIPVTKKDDNERLPWQVSVFSKREEPFRSVCGASMISRTTLISAAHCFWEEGKGLLPASWFAVGAGEVLTYRPDDYSSYRQQNDVGSIRVPMTYNGAASNYQHDIAVVKLARAFYDSSGMRPVCVSFDGGLEAEQLTPDNNATTLGVDIQQKGKLTHLEKLTIPYVSREECRRTLLPKALKYFTDDKICAGFKIGGPVLKKICTRDAGAGLAFYLGDKQDLAKGIAVPFLRGVASSSLRCDARYRTLYTSLAPHMGFLMENIEGLVEECGKYYPQLGAFLARRGTVGTVTQFVCNCHC